MLSPENRRSVGARHGTARPDVKVPHTHPHSQFIPSRQSQTVKSKEVLGIFWVENSKELPKGRGDRGCVMKIPQGMRLLLGICINTRSKGASDGFLSLLSHSPHPTPNQKGNSHFLTACFCHWDTWASGN